MANKTKEQYIEDLKKLDPDFPVKEDHNLADLKRFVKLFEAEQGLKDKDKKIDALKQAVSELESAVEELNLKLGEAKIDNPTVKVGKSNYRVLHGVNYKRQDYSKEQIAEDSSVAAALVKIKSSALEIIEED